MRLEKRKKYQHLEGKEVTYNFDDEEDVKYELIGVVQYIDPKYGITIGKKGEPETRLMCLMHPKVMELKQNEGNDITQGMYRKQFKLIVEELEKDKPRFTYAFYEKLADTIGGTVCSTTLTSDDCAFSL